MSADCGIDCAGSVGDLDAAVAAGGHVDVFAASAVVADIF